MRPRLNALNPKKGVALGLILISIAGVLILGGKALDLPQRLADALAWIEGLGAAGMGVYAGLYILACIFFVPATWLSLGAGAIYGVVVGSVLVSVSSTLGATAAFLVSRYIARGWMAKKRTENTRLTAIDDAVAAEGWKIVGLTRLSPVFSFNLLNYVYGLTRIPLREYVLASWVGMMPGTVMYVYMGSLASDLTRLGAESNSPPTPAQWTLRIVAFLATLWVTISVAKMAKKVLKEKIHP